MRDESTTYGSPPRSALGPISRLLAASGVLSCMLLGSLGSAHAAPAGLHVVDTTPSAGASSIGATGFVSITFDRPVVTLNDVGAPGARTPVIITPALPGKGRWINTSVWGYQAGLPLATRYQIITRPGLQAQDGSVLEGTYSFSFTTLRPDVVSVSPPGATRNALPNAAVQVIFNQPVQHASAQHAFSFTADGMRLLGRFSWNDKLIATQPNGVSSVPQKDTSDGSAPAQPEADTVMTFHPATRTPLGASVVASIAPGVLGKQGPLGMAAPYSWRYSVAGTLRITGSTPIADNGNANLSNGLVLTLTAPVTQAQAAKAIHVSPTLSSQYVYVDDNGTTVTISGDFQPSTAYTVTMDTRAIGTASQALAAPYRLHFTTQATIPSVQLVSQGPAAVYNEYLGANIYARVVNLAAITVRVNRLSAGQFLGLMYNPPQNWSGGPPANSPQIASYTVSSSAPRNRSILVKQPLQGIGPGYYLVNAGPGAGGGNAGDHLLVLVTRTSVTLKIGQRQAFVWATDLRSGKPVAGESVRIVDNKGRVWSSGSTGADGVFKAGVHGVGASDSLLQHTLQAQLTHGADVAAAGLDWNSGVSSYDFNLPFNSYQQPVRIYLTTERPIYRPGQPVYFKGIARADSDGRYSLLPVGTRVRVRVLDARQASIYDQRLTVDHYGAFNGKLILSAGASVGGYTISASAGVSGGNSAFQVAEYKKPAYAVSAISDRGANANYQQGQSVGVQVRARYYFGAPLTKAPVTWDLTQNDFYFTSSLFPDYDFVDNDYATTRQQTFYGQQTTEGHGTTGAHGDFHFGVSANIKNDPVSQQYTLEATVTGPDNSQVADSTQVVVHKAAFYVGIRPADYLGVAGTPSTLRLVTVSDDGDKVVHGVPVTAKIYKRVWLSSFVRDANGFYYWQDRHKDTLVAVIPVHTDSSGRASAIFTPRDGGEYRIVATATDGAGHVASASTSLWVVASGATYVPWAPQNNDRIQLVADKKTYVPGETAHILVTAPLAGMTALVTVERGTILSQRVLTLKTNSEQIDVPVAGDYAPDVYVSVTLVKGPGADTAIPVWKIGYVALPVDTSARSLHVRITASTPKARPGQKITFAIHATDATGKGVQAQLAVSLVDKAVLALATNSNTGLMDTFYQQRELGVQSAGSLTLYIDRLNLNQQVGSKGGSGGGGGGAQGPTRQQFPDTAYWNPSVLTDANGNASVTITLPDNLTTWTFAALGGTAGTLVGQSSMDIISSKLLLLEPALPRFLTVGDSVGGGAVVDNLTGKSQQVRMTLHTSGTGQPADYNATVRVPAGGSQLVQWLVAANAVGSQQFLFTAQATGDASLGDRLLATVPVQPNSILQVASSSGLFSGSTTQAVQIPAGIQKSQGDLTVSLTPSLVSGLGTATSYLTQYPYDDVEATISQASGLADTQHLPARVSGLSAGLRAGISTTVGADLQRLYNAQNSDGGWGWWAGDTTSNPYISAYVLEGLTSLRTRGYIVDSGVLGHAVKFVHGWAVNPPAANYPSDATSTLDLQAYSAYVLGQAGTPDNGLTFSLYSHRQNLYPFARAYLALAIARISGSGDLRVHALLNDVAGAAQHAGNQAHWRNGEPDWAMMDEAVSATSIALQALVRLDPANPLTLAGVRWLMAQRVDGNWGSTQSTNEAIRALAVYAARTQPLSGSSQISVQVNGVSIGSGTIATDSGAGQSFTISLANLPATSQVTVRQHGGTGQMAYTITLHTYLPVTSVPAVEHGISITRQYQPVGSGHYQAGSDVRVVLTLTAAEDLYYLAIEDPLPAGAEPVDPTLRTTSVLSGITSQTTIPQGTNDLGWYISHVELRDDRAALFANFLPAGTYQYSYQIHLTSAGTFHALPTQSHLTYFPDVYGHGTGRLFTIKAQ